MSGLPPIRCTYTHTNKHKHTQTRSFGVSLSQSQAQFLPLVCDGIHTAGDHMATGETPNQQCEHQKFQQHAPFNAFNFTLLIKKYLQTSVSAVHHCCGFFLCVSFVCFSRLVIMQNYESLLYESAQKFIRKASCLLNHGHNLQAPSETFLHCNSTFLHSCS